MKLYISPLLKKWSFENDFIIETKDGKLLSALCKYYSEVEYNNFMQDARSRNIKRLCLN